VLSFEASAVTQATPEAVFDVWTDIDGWAELDQIERASIDREFGPGAVIKTKGKGLPSATLVVTVVDRPDLWIDESRFPGVRMTFEHLVSRADSGTKITERATISGVLARFVAPIVRRRLLALMTSSTEHIAARATRRA
jgi:hypothetical protein